MTPRQAAEQRMTEAKLAMTAAAHAALNGDQDAQQRATRALTEVDAARASLRGLEAFT